MFTTIKTILSITPITTGVTMEKCTESYEYLSSNNAESNCDQFFIIEDDGTFLTYKPVQYVAHVQQEKNTLEDVQSQQSSMYDVTPQQLLVDVDNCTEHIMPGTKSGYSLNSNYHLVQTSWTPEFDECNETVTATVAKLDFSFSDSSILPNGDLYCNSYFLQTEASTYQDDHHNQVENDDIGNLGRQNDMQIVEITSEGKQNATEIMLTDEQYSLLEQKGWILLEISNKVFVLDTSGLQDITNNHELIQQLKAEVKNDMELCSRSIDENVSSKIKLELNSQESSMFETESTMEAEENTRKMSNPNKAEMEDNDLEENAEIEIVKTEKEMLGDKLNDIDSHTVGDTILIKTKLLLKDIPNKIVLGKTINGKKLVAKLVPKQKKVKSCENKPYLPKRKKPGPCLPSLTKVATPQSGANIPIHPDRQFNFLVEYAQTGQLKCSEEHVAAAKRVVAQFLQVAAFQRAVVGKNLFITRAVKSKSANALNESMVQSVVLGTISEINGEQQFVYIPDMMLNLANTGDKDPHYITHVHVTETKQQDATQSISISIVRRPLPPTTAKSLRQSKVFACSTCASIFPSEKELLDHQDTHFIEAEDSLTIDTEEIVNNDEEQSKTSPYCIVKTDKGILYSCLKCPLKFNKLCNFRRHIKTHSRPTTEIDNTDSETSIDKIYKCKMCTSSYYYASTLSKHIVTAHINVKSEKI